MRDTWCAHCGAYVQDDPWNAHPVAVVDAPLRDPSTTVVRRILVALQERMSASGHARPGTADCSATPGTSLP
jgi:hypothetical protein